MRRRFVLLPVVAVLAACASSPPPRPHGGPPGTRAEGRPEGRGVFISPMGEPFRGPGGRTALIGAWFAGADTDHDGRLTLAEMKADAARFFKTLDTDGDGEIDPAELSHYENEVAPEIRVRDAGPGARSGGGGGSHGGRGGGGGGRGGGGGGGGGGGHRGGSGSTDASSNPNGATPHQSLGVEGAARYGLLDLPEPVAAADADFNRSITAREFAAAAAARFEALDGDGDGYLTLAKLVRR